MRHAAVAAEIAIPLVVRRIQAELRHARVEHVQPLLALAAADDLADAGRQHVHRRDGLPVVVQAHVERLDLLGIVRHHDRTADMLLGEPALVFGLEVQAPFDRVVELLLRLLQQRHRIGVVDALERGIDERAQSRDRGLLDPLGDERHVVAALGQHRLEQVFEEFLGEVGVGGEVGERDLRLDHPELGEVARGVAVLGTEGRPERVDLAQREAVRLDVELAGHGEERLLAEEITAEVDLAPCVARQVREVERRHAEHLPGAFGVGRRDDRRADPVEAAFVEEPVHRLRQAVADARHRAEQVRARPQVRDLAQEFERMRLGLDRIGFRVLDPADDLDRGGLDLEFLPLALRRGQRAGGDHRAAGRQLPDVVEAGQGLGGHELDRVEAGAVADVDEVQPARRPVRADPAAHRDVFADGDAAGEGLLHAHHCHDLNLCRFGPM